MLNFNVKHHLLLNVQQLFVLFVAAQTNNVAKRGSRGKKSPNPKQCMMTAPWVFCVFREGKSRGGLCIAQKSYDAKTPP